MGNNKMILSLQVAVFALMLMLGAFVAGQWTATKEEPKPHEKWLLVSNDLGDAFHGLWVVSPKGDWHIVPEAYKNDFKGLKEGASMPLPATLNSWDKCLVPPKGEEMAKLWRGYSIQDGLMKSKYFFKL
jgi:hypothetical protein